MFSTSILERQRHSAAGTHRSSLASSSAPGGDLENDTMFQDLATLMDHAALVLEEAPEEAPAPAGHLVETVPPRAAPATASPPPSRLRSPGSFARPRTGGGSARRSPASAEPRGAGSEPRLRPRSLQFCDKENRLPTGGGDGRGGKSLAANWTELREVDQLKQKLVQEEKLRSQAEAQITENRKFRRNVAEVQQQLETKSATIDALQRRCEELEGLRTEAQTRARGHAEALDRAQVALDERERQAAAMQLDLDRASQRLEEHEHMARECAQKFERMALYLEDERARSHLAAPAPAPAAPESLPQPRGAELARMIESLEAGLARSTDALWEELDRVSEHASKNTAGVEELRARRCGTTSRSAGTSPLSAAATLDPPHVELCDASTQADSPQEKEETTPSRKATADCSSEGAQAAADEVAKLQAALAEMAGECEAQRRQVAEARSEVADEKFFTACVERALDEKSAQQREAQAELERLMAEREAMQPDATVANDEEKQELLAQNRELTLTMQMFKQDCESLSAENESLRESMASFEENLDRVASQNARLLGHSNTRQKIHYTFKLKEENGRLRHELRAAQKELLQLQGNKRAQDVLTALAPFCVDGHRQAAGVAASSSSPGSAAPGVPSACAARQARRSVRGAGLPATVAEDGEQPLRRLDAEAARRLEAERSEAVERCRMLERGLERVSLDFRHFKALLERAVSATKDGEAPECSSDAAKLLAQLRSAAAKRPR